MINFLEEKYGAKVSCDQVSQDGYEVCNLITHNNHKSLFSKSSGFLVEHFIKPPVNITFVFPLQIQVSFIELGLCVGAQTTDGIEVLVADHQDLNGLLRGVFHRWSISERHLKISNTSFRARPPFLDSNSDLNYPRRDAKYAFKFSHLLNHVRIIRLRLTKTLGSSVPALGSVKVVGVPASSCRPEELRSVLQLYESNSEEPTEDPDIQILPTNGLGEIKKKNKVPNVPEEFLDALTFEIMAQPILLPSGQSVDQSTLEKSNSSQSSWGRIPYDPFTGIPFGPGRQPVSNASLKARIDAFLIKNAHLDPSLANVPRSLGEKPKEFSTFGKPSQSQSGYSQGTSTKMNESVQHKGLLESRSETPSSSHEQALQDSLNAALNLYCKNIPAKHKRVGCTKVIKGCVGCGASSCGPKYKLPCGHSLCRTCLLSAQNCCLNCKQRFQRDQVFRTYSIP